MKSWHSLAISVAVVFSLTTAAAEGAAGNTGIPHRISNIEQIQEIIIQSRILGEERTLLVRLPQGYEEGSTSYPVLVMLDAEWHFNTAASDVEFLSECSYIKSHAVPRLIIVGVINKDRNRDFTPTNCPEYRGMKFPTSGGAEQFRRFLIEEVIPLIDGTYRTWPFRILAGWSLGGLFTINTLLCNTPVFDSYLAISPSLWWDDDLVLKRLAKGGEGTGPSERKQLIVTLGTVEKENNSMVARATGEFMGYLAQNPFEKVSVEEVPIEGLGHNYSPKMAYFYGLATVFADLTLPEETLGQGLVAIDDYYARQTARYKFEITVPEDVYGKLGWNLFEEGQLEDSGEVFRTWVDRHPESALALASLGSFCRETGDGENAVELFRRAIAIEEQSSRPRESFINDLRRDIEALQSGRNENGSQ